MNDLLLQNITVNKLGQFILKDINLSFEKNKIYGVMGHNGAGKTTLFRCLLGLVKYSGIISLEGVEQNEENRKEYLKQIGIVMPFPEKYDNLSIEDLIKEHLFYMGYSNKVEIQKMLNNVGLFVSEATTIKDLSLGMKQRLNIAIALSHNPSIFILDEPLNGLDKDGVDQLVHIIQNFKNENKIVIISSHSFGDFESIIDEMIILKNGEIVEKRRRENESDLFI